MKNKIINIIILISAIIITVLFHNQSLGINLFIFEIAFFTWLMISKQIKLKGKNLKIGTSGFLLTSVFTILTHSIFSFFMHFLALFIFIGLLIYPEVKSYINSILISLTSLFNSQIQFFKNLSNSKLSGYNIGVVLWKSRIFILPLVVIFIFILIYCSSNPIFNKLAISIGTWIQEAFDSIFKNFDFSIVLTFIIGLFISNYLFLRISNQHIIKADLNSSDELMRFKKKFQKYFSLIVLKNEYRSAVFLLMVLNVVLFVLNVLDIKWVWFNFEWEGQYLRQFVHEGTYLLIISILISMALVLFFFRKNLNFYRNNKLLKYLSYVWLAQNGILVISVAIRNFWYIHYFSLAYKRIGVIIFLILTIYGLYTILIKVRRKKSVFYLLRSNAFALYLVLILSSIINWDTMIAKYNFNHANKSFVHLNYLSTLSDKTLPYLDKSMAELSFIDETQKKKFPFERKFMSPEQYHQVIEDRKIAFKQRWESQSILSWNLPEYLAYQKLFGKN